MMDTGINQKILKDTHRAGKVPTRQRVKDLQPLSILRYLIANKFLVFPTNKMKLIISG